MRKKFILSALLSLCSTLLFCACTSSSAKTIDVGEETIPTLYSVLNVEKKVTGGSKSASTDSGSTNEITYKSGSISADELNQYIQSLCDSGYLIIEDTQVSSDGTETFQIGKNASQEGKRILITFSWKADGNTVITYNVSNGAVNPVENPASSS